MDRLLLRAARGAFGACFCASFPCRFLFRRLRWIGPKNHPDVTDRLNLLSAELRAQPHGHLLADFAPDTGQTHLDEFMVMQRSIGFRQHRIAKPRISNQDYGFQRVRAGAQFFSLHGGHEHARYGVGGRVSGICA